MLDFLDRLRQKPPHVRMQITYVATSLLFLVISTVWWTSWTAGGTTTTNIIATEKSPINVVADTFSGIRDETVSSWRETISNVQNLASSTDVAAVGASGIDGNQQNTDVNTGELELNTGSTNENSMFTEFESPQ